MFFCLFCFSQLIGQFWHKDLSFIISDTITLWWLVTLHDHNAFYTFISSAPHNTNWYMKNILFHFNSKKCSDASNNVQNWEPLYVAVEQQSVVLQKLNRIIINPRILPLRTYPKELKLIFQINTHTATLVVRAEDGNSLNTPQLMNRQRNSDTFSPMLGNHKMGLKLKNYIQWERKALLKWHT